MRTILSLMAGAAIAAAAPAHAQDEAFEIWLNPSVEYGIDDDTAIELETAQRFRSSEDGREDTYFFRLWAKQDLSDNITLAGAVEKRLNDPGSDEIRTMQQLSTSYGIFKTRLRLEQRFPEGADQMGLRLRPRVGIGFDLDDEGRWSFGTDAELFWTLRPRNVGGDTGLTGLRTTVGFGYEVSDRLEVDLAYLRQQDFENDAPDVVGHAPLIGISYSF